MIELVGGASTQSRARRPLPPGATLGVSLTEHSIGAREMVEFHYDDGHSETKMLLSWVLGQWGGLWGHGPYPPEVMRELSRWEVQGSYGNGAEYRLADALGEVYAPYITSSEIGVRFFQSGGEACAAAARVARAATGRQTIATQGYHGAALDFVHLPAIHGQEFALEMHERFEFGDLLGMQQAADQSACIMVEVPSLDDEDRISMFLNECQTVAVLNGAPFIMDDVVTGFRVALGGACERYGVKADMICLGKAMSAIGGVAALIGRRDLVGRLDDDVFYSTTFGGDPMRCSIAEKTIRFLQRERMGIYQDGEHYGYLASIGLELKRGLNERGVKCIGQPERSAIVFSSEDEKVNFCRRMIGSGILMHQPNYTTLVHTLRDVEMTLDTVEEVISK